MKTNEAPEKLYYAPYGDIREDYPITDNDIEYTRTDVFIKKACEFINKANLYLYHCISEECDLVDTDKMIEDFKKLYERRVMYD